MDLKVYYRKIREAMESIPGEYTVLVSRETPDGGKAGVMSEASKATAARMLVEGRARLATTEETAEYRRLDADARKKVEQQTASSRLQVAVLTEKDLAALKANWPAKPADEK